MTFRRPRKKRLVETVSVPPATRVTARVYTPAASLRFLRKKPRTAMQYLTRTAQGAADGIASPSFTLYVRSFENKLIYLPTHTVLGVALPSPENIMAAFQASSGVAEVMERRENGNEGTSCTDNAKTSKDKIRVGLDADTIRRAVQQLLEEF